MDHLQGGMYTFPMVNDLLFRARAAQLEPPVRVAALLRIARVQTAFDRGHARIIHVLQHLDPPLAESLIAGHEQLASAIRRFPHGRESIFEENEERHKQSMAACAACGGGFGMSGDPKDRPYMMAMMQASKDGDFGPAIAHALEQYQEDTDPKSPNLAPKPVWPSTSSFRSILYQAGRQMGADAAVYLDRVPEDDLHLFAHIELEAALAGLPELQAIQSTYRPPQRPS